jgi:hypothetical protein
VPTEHLSELFTAFVLPQRQERYVRLLESRKGRAKLRASLAHLKDLDPRHARRIAANEHDPAAIARQLKARGAPTDCYLLSESTELDDKVLPLENALTMIVGRGLGTLLSCVPGRLAYYEGEEAGERYILERAAV